jgi:hypothetical protein
MLVQYVHVHFVMLHVILMLWYVHLLCTICYLANCVYVAACVYYNMLFAPLFAPFIVLRIPSMLHNVYHNMLFAPLVVSLDLA